MMLRLINRRRQSRQSENYAAAGVQSAVPAASAVQSLPAPVVAFEKAIDLSPQISSDYKHASIRSVRTTASMKLQRRLVAGVKEELQCSICLDEFTLPRLLHCGHSFCTACLKSIQHATNIRCPTCRYLTKFPNPQAPLIEDLPVNYAITKILDVMHGWQRQVIRCEAHHSEEVKFYCVTCQLPLCSECIVAKEGAEGMHMDHQLLTIKQAAFNLFQRLKMHMATVSEASSTAEDLSNKTRTAMTESGLQFVHLHSQLLQHFEAIESMVATKKNAMLSELHALKESRQSLLQEHHQHLRKLHGELHAAMSRTEALIREHPRMAEVAEKSEAVIPPWSKASSDIFSLWQQGQPLLKHLESLPSAETIESTYAVPNYHVQCAISPNHDAASIQQIMDRMVHLKVGDEPAYKMQIFVKGLDGKTTACGLLPWETDAVDLMRKIESQLGIPIEVQRVYYQGKILSPYTSDIPPRPTRLCEYDIGHEATVHLNLGVAVCAHDDAESSDE